MYIGAHVSPAGGPANAITRGVERGCHAIQIFCQNPRSWKPNNYSEEQVAAFRERMSTSQIKELVIHAAYLLNCASENEETREKTLACLVASLNVGAQLGAKAVVLHPGSAKTSDPKEAIKRAGETIREALMQSDPGCALHLENTAGSGGTLGRSFAELGELIEAAGGSKRLGICLDSCHLFAAGFAIQTADGLSKTLAECKQEVGMERLGSLHMNDSVYPLGSNRDRHANLGEGELGEEGCAVFLSEPAFEGLPCILETPGARRSGPEAKEVEFALKLRKRGLADRSR